MGPLLWLSLLFIICPAAGTLTLTLLNDPILVDTNVTLLWVRQSQDPQEFLLQTVPPSPQLNPLVDAQNSTGTVNLVFNVLGDFAVQAVDPKNPSNLLQETSTFSVVPAPTAASTTTATTTVTTTSPTSTAILSTIATPPPTASPSSSGATSSHPPSSAIIALAVVLSLVILSALIFLAFFIKRRRDNAIKRHTFHADLMAAPRCARSPGPSLPPIPHTPTEDLYAVNRVFDIRPPPAMTTTTTEPVPTWLSRSRTVSSPREMVNASTERLVSVRPLPTPQKGGAGGKGTRTTSPTMVDLNAARQNLISTTRPLPPYPPILREGGAGAGGGGTSTGMGMGNSVSASRLQFLPPLNTNRLTQYRAGTDDADVMTAGTTASTHEMRVKMREAIQKMRRMRASGLQVEVPLPPPPPYDMEQHK